MNKSQTVFIIDMGSGYLKCGLPSLPKPVITPAAFRAKQSASKDSIYSKLDPGRVDWEFPLEGGILPNKADALIKLCELAFDQFPELKGKNEELELSLLFFPLTNADHITTFCKEIQETLGCSHVDAAIQQILTWGYWSQRTGLIIDIGYSTTFITPIYRGFLLEEQILPLVTGSFFISAALRKFLLVAADVAGNKEAAIYEQIAENGEAISEIKQSLSRIYPLSFDKETKPELDIFYQFDEQKISLGTIPWQASEVLFQPTILGVGDKGLSDAIFQVLNQVDSTVRSELASNIVLSGGGAMFPGLKTRLENDLKERMPHLPMKLYDLEYPLYSAWLGAARM